MAFEVVFMVTRRIFLNITMYLLWLLNNFEIEFSKKIGSKFVLLEPNFSRGDDYLVVSPVGSIYLIFFCIINRWIFPLQRLINIRFVRARV